MKKSFTLILASMLAFTYAMSSPTPDTTQSVVSNLYITQADGTTVLMDGALTQYDPSYNNAIDGLDARKMSNFSENLGMIRGTTTLVIERRHIIEVSDSIFYKIWNLQQGRNYRLEFLISAMNLPGLSGYIEDQYLHVKTPLNLDGSNYLDFTINSNISSSDMYRFRIIFDQAACTSPITFTYAKAFRQNSDIDINWKTNDENNLKDYTVEKCVDGKSFSSLESIIANNSKNNSYNYADVHPATGDNYYRIRTTRVNGEIAFSDIMKVHVDKGFAVIQVFPNPVAGNAVHLQLMNQPQGEYDIRLVTNFGQIILKTKIQHPGGGGTQTITPAGNLSKGMYRLFITSPDGKTSELNVIF